MDDEGMFSGSDETVVVRRPVDRLEVDGVVWIEFAVELLGVEDVCPYCESLPSRPCEPGKKSNTVTSYGATESSPAGAVSGVGGSISLGLDGSVGALLPQKSRPAGVGGVRG